MKVLVTGATGFVGRHLVNTLIDQGHRVYCLVRNAEKAIDFLPPAAQLIEGDLCSKHKLNLPEASGVEVLCHLVGCVSSVRVRDFFRVNVYGTQKILEITKSLSKLRKFIFLSSTAVIGRNFRGGITEEVPCNPFSPYGKSKLEAENLIRNFSENLSQVSFLIIRAPIIFGPGQPEMVTRFFEDIGRGKVALLGGGKNIRSMCYIKNLIDAISALVSSSAKVAHLEVLNVADAEKHNLVNITHAIACAMGREKVIILRIPLWFSDMASFVYKMLTAVGINSRKLFVMATASANMDIDITKASHVINFYPRYHFSEALSETISWLRDTKQLKRNRACTFTR